METDRVGRQERRCKQVAAEIDWREARNRERGNKEPRKETKADCG